MFAISDRTLFEWGTRLNRKFRCIVKLLPKTDEIANFSKYMKDLLLKKEIIFGRLKLIFSRTEETRFIDELTEDVVDIFKRCNIPTGFPENGETNVTEGSIITIPIVAQCYNYLLLNTHFPSQPLLRGDFLYGHVLNIWPTLSPYLFIQIIWRLKYDEVLVESLQHIPLDLCAEILEITTKCLTELETERAISLTFSLMERIYSRCLLLDGGNTQSMQSVKELLHQLMAYFLMLLNLLDKFACYPELSTQERYKRHGILLKRIFRHVKFCVCNGIETTVLNPIFAFPSDLYELTYGNSSLLPDCVVYKPSMNELDFIITTVSKESIMLLLQQLKRIDLNEYNYWAEIRDEENPRRSLQQTIVFEYYHFMDYAKEEEFLKLENILHDWPKHILTDLFREIPSRLENCETHISTLQELCDRIANDEEEENMKEEDMKELMKRYKEWDLSTLNFVCEKMKLWKKADLWLLFEHLHYVFKHSRDPHVRIATFEPILLVLLKTHIVNVHFMVLEYTMRHLEDNYLMILYDQKKFNEFMANNISIRNPSRMHQLLIHILLNPKMVLRTLVKIILDYNEGDANYDDINLTPYDILMLRPFLCIKTNSGCNLLVAILKEVCVHDSNWSTYNMTEFITVMLKYQVVEADDLMNYFYIPYLIDTSYQDNTHSVLQLMYMCLSKMDCTHKTNYTLLITALTKKMSLTRKCCRSCSKDDRDSVLISAMYILDFLTLSVRHIVLMMSQQCESHSALNSWIEPLDRARILTYLDNVDPETHSLEIIRNYEKRCLTVFRRFRMDSQSNPELHKYVHSFNLDRESFIRHAMLHATVKEFEWFASELTLKIWGHLGWTSEFEAFENVLRIASEAMQLTIIFDDTFTQDLFVVLLYAIVLFCKTFAEYQKRCNYKLICEVFLKNLLLMREKVNRTQYSHMYLQLIARVKDITIEEPYLDQLQIEDYFDEIGEWIHVYLDECQSLFQVEETTCDCSSNTRTGLAGLNFFIEQHMNNNSSNIATANMYKAYRFICACLNPSNTDLF